MGITTAAGKPLDIDPGAAPAADDAEQKFAAAMAAPAGDHTPPRRGARAQPAADDKPARTPRAARAPRAPSAPAPASVTRDQILTGVAGLMQVPAGVCLMLAPRVADPVPLLADAVAFTAGAGPLAKACADTAEHDQRFARVMARVCAAGPYAALTGVGVGIAAQVARNHGMLALPGTQDPGALVRRAGTTDTGTGEDTADGTS